MLQQVVERFTAHYVFALGLSRFLSCAHWVLQVGMVVVTQNRQNTAVADIAVAEIGCPMGLQGNWQQSSAFRMVPSSLFLFPVYVRHLSDSRSVAYMHQLSVAHGHWHFHIFT